MKNRFILIGKVVRPQGIKGLIRVKPFADIETFMAVETLFLGSEDIEPARFDVISSKQHQGAILLGLEGVKTMSQAEKLVGTNIYTDRDALPKLEDGEYYWFEVLGLDVFTEEGQYLGKIKEILPTGSNDVYVVQDKTKEYLIPAIADVVKKIDLSDGRATIHLLKGLLGE